MAELLIDEGIGQDLVRRLRAQGLRIFHTLEFLPKGASDSLVFLEAQQRRLTVFTWNHKHFPLLADAWRDWGHGDHYGVISRFDGRPQLLPPDTYPSFRTLD
jgi:Domain of unknown function (DUF5615)